MFVRTPLDMKTDVMDREFETLGASDESLLENGLRVREDVFAAREHQLLFNAVDLVLNC